MAKNITNEEQAAVFSNLNDHYGAVYSKIGEQVHDLDEDEEEMLDSMMPMQSQMQQQQQLSSGSFGMMGSSNKSSGFTKEKVRKSKFAGKQSDSLATEII